MPPKGPDEHSKRLTLMRMNGGFRLLIAGSSVSVLGTRVTTIAYPLLVLYLTSSPATAGCVAFAATAPGLLLYIPVGALVDRWDPRRTMLVSETGRGITIGIVAVTLIRGRPSVTLLLSAVIAEEILKAFSTLAEPRFVCSLVANDKKRSALASMEGRTHAATIAGRPLGAFLFGLQHTLPFLFDSTSFLFSIATLISIPKRAAGMAATKAQENLADLYQETEYRNDLTRPHRWSAILGQDIFKALSWLKSHPRTTIIIFLAAGATLISQALIMIFLATADERHLSSAMIGMVLATSGIGGTAGAMAGSRLKALLTAPRLENSAVSRGVRMIIRRPLIQIQLWVWTAAFAALCIPSGKSFFTMAIVMTISGFTGALSNIQFNTYLMTNVPPPMLAKVTSVGNFMSTAACAIGPAVGGVLIQNYNTAYALNSLFGITLVVAIISVGVPSMRSHRDAATTTGGTDQRPQILEDQPSGVAAHRSTAILAAGAEAAARDLIGDVLSTGPSSVGDLVGAGSAERREVARA